MEEKEFPKPESAGSLKSKLGGLYNRSFGIIKLILGICLLPFVYSATRAFLNESSVLDKATSLYFYSGLVSFLVVYLFIYEPVIIYARGQKILEAIFRFFTPLVKVAPYLLPIYTILLLVLYPFYANFDKSANTLRIFMLLIGFSIALHLVFSAKSLRSKQGDFLKSNYIFGFSFVYIINIAILALGFSLFFAKFSFVNFCNQTFQIAQSIFSEGFKQLFL
ncbi:MAG: hypothetical protein V2A59_02930 [Candidatus Omnitrophota bacterium]